MAKGEPVMGHDSCPPPQGASFVAKGSDGTSRRGQGVVGIGIGGKGKEIGA